MSWESPITLKRYEMQPIAFDREPPEETFRKGQEFVEKAAKEMADAWDDYVVTKVRDTMDIDIDKYELAKALQYDRDQYNKGYHDAKAEIVYCKDCKHSKDFKYSEHHPLVCKINLIAVEEDFYCSDGERKTNIADKDGA